MKEFELIERITAGLPSGASVLQGAGDDCAVLLPGQPGTHLLFKTDAVVEGIHFTRNTEPHRIGHKALARCLSDIAAMGGRPVSAVVTLALPEGYDAEFIHRVYDGMGALASRFGVAIVGGETTTNPERLLISIALIGEVAAGKAILRSGAKPGDAIFVSGELGGSISGRHLDFEPRLEQAAWLASNFDVHSMIDLSDGLAGDLRHILRRSGVGADLLEQMIPVSRQARLAATTTPGAKPPLAAALTDGEDFELLFTVAAGDAVRLKDGWKAAFPAIKISCIGKISDKPGLRIKTRMGIREIQDHGYEHFSQS